METVKTLTEFIQTNLDMCQERQTEFDDLVAQHKSVMGLVRSSMEETEKENNLLNRELNELKERNRKLEEELSSIQKNFQFNLISMPNNATEMAYFASSYSRIAGFGEKVDHVKALLGEAADIARDFSSDVSTSNE